ncbi:hypothetical protein FHG87_016965 [Trinorchestia longiramus]|nr:hypothetical protein FHG87_016965 [Trinorchestia longiramus]
MRWQLGKGKVNEVFTPPQEEERSKTRSTNSERSAGKKCACGVCKNFAAERKLPLEVRFSSSTTPGQCCAAEYHRDSVSNWKGFRRSSEASKSSKMSVLTEDSSPRSSDTSLESLDLSSTSGYASDSAVPRSPDSVFTLGGVPLPTLYEHTFRI